MSDRCCRLLCPSSLLPLLLLPPEPHDHAHRHPAPTPTTEPLPAALRRRRTLAAVPARMGAKKPPMLWAMFHMPQ